MTQLSLVSAPVKCGTGSVAATPVALPVANVDDHERYEGMLVSYSQTLTATDVFNLGRFGEVSLSGAGRLYNTTAVALPGAPAEAVAAQNARSRIILDDTSNTQNNDPTRYPQGGLSATNTLRVGDTLSGLDGVMDFRFGSYRIQPVGAVNFVATNLRTPAPAAVGGNLKVASFNVLNYFNDFGCGDRCARGARESVRVRPAGGQDRLRAEGDRWRHRRPDGDRERRRSRQCPRRARCRAQRRDCTRHLRVHRHGRDRDRCDQGRPDLQAGRGRAGGSVGHPDDVRRPPVHRHAEPADTRADVPAAQLGTGDHGRREPPEVEGLGLRRAPDDQPDTGRRELQRHPHGGCRGARRLARRRSDRERRSRTS